MSTANPPNALNNPYIASLKTTFAASTAPIEWLIICHNDRHLIGELLAAAGGRPAALLQVPQENWDDHLLREAVAWGVHNASITNIVLAGHSQTGPSKERLTRGEQNTEVAGYGRLVDGARHFSMEIEIAHRRFVEHADRLMGTPEVQVRVVSGAISVHPLLYRADSGLFFAYDFENGCFGPRVQ